ncbi:glycosyltransferase BC10-like [Silene latifolia]|uniref:glycosyltransferase BC10-like n=1 Tax=Silene latifolia TaxID=37657 RepID=UPI003D76DA1F
MLSPNPFTLFCALLLCFPLALLFSLSSNNNTTNSPTLFIPHLHHHASSITFLSLPPPPPPSPSPLKPPLTPLYKTTSKQVKSTFPKIPFPSPPPPPPPLKSTTSKRLKSTLAKIPSSTPPPPRTPRYKSRKNPRKRNTSKQRNSSLPKIPLPTPPPHAPPPPYPEDDKDDIDLLRRASRVNPDPVGGPKKVAFLFLTTTPLPFAPIWENFFNQSDKWQSQYNIYIHTNPDRKSNLTGVFHNRVIPKLKPTARNTPTLVSAARRLLAHALLHDPNNYMFTLLSASCIPLHSFNFTYTTLTNSNKSFIEILNNETTAYSRWAARGEHAMLPEVPLELFRIGSQFWSLTRKHARVVVRDVKLWRKFGVPCVDIDVCFPEENYFPTLLSMVDPEGVVPATLTNVNWEGSYDGHPRTYNETEVGEELIRWLRESRPRYGEMGINGSDLTVMQRWDPFLFARKFAPSCVQPLLNITNHVLFKD